MKVVDKKHAKLAPSGSKRWITCTGSPRLERQCPEDKGSIYANEGTAAHELAEMCLRNNKEAMFYRSTVIQVESDYFTVDEEMAEAVQVYVDEIRSRREPHDKILIEEQFHLEAVHPDIFGTSDCALFRSKANELDVLDYKHGVGVIVDPDWNSQLMIYAVGVVVSMFDKGLISAERMRTLKINLVIVQPRARTGDKIKEWTLTGDQLMNWVVFVLRPAAYATESPDAPLIAGDHCNFCRAMAVCPEIARKSCELAKTTFQDPVLPEPSELTTEQLLRVLDLSGLMNKWVSSVVEFIKHKLEIGETVPGYKLVQGITRRKWVDEDEVEAVLVDALGDEAPYKKTLLSPSQAEKALKKAGESPEVLLEGLWDKPEGKPTLVPESDKRAALPPTMMDAFLDDDCFS